MTSKKEFEMVFNGLLGTDIEWSKLPKENLIELAVLFKNPEILIKKLTSQSESASGITVGDVAMLALENWPGPLVKGLRDLATGKKPDPEKA